MVIAERILGFIRAHQLESAPRSLVACSGGPDSTVLAHALLRLWRDRLIGQPTLVYIDHGLRASAREEGARVTRLAAGFGAEAIVHAVTVDQGVASLENAARDARYAALEEVAEGAPVFVGHTSSDQAETVLMRIVRGTGIRGLSAIPEARQGYFRPLLSVSRAEILEYVAEHRLEVADDPMNQDPRFFRARVRHRWLPELRAENPRLEQALARLATMAAEVDASLEFAGDAILLASALDPSTVRASVLAAAPKGVTRPALLRLAEAQGVGPLSASHLEALWNLVTAPNGGSRELALPGGAALREYDRLRIVARQAPRLGLPPQWEIVVTGSGGPYQIRNWQAGDRMRPTRLGGRSRKLSDLFADARVPKHSRQNARIVVREADGTIVWAEHIGLAADARVQVSLTR